LKPVAAAPVRDHRLALVAGRDEHLPRADLAAGGLHDPAPVVCGDALDARAELQVDPVLVRVALEVLDELVAGREHRRALGKRRSGRCESVRGEFRRRRS
jgi:hypothetical protein